jgi:hypothetical protein
VVSGAGTWVEASRMPEIVGEKKKQEGNEHKIRFRRTAAG